MWGRISSRYLPETSEPARHNTNQIQSAHTSTVPTVQWSTIARGHPIPIRTTVLVNHLVDSLGTVSSRPNQNRRLAPPPPPAVGHFLPLQRLAKATKTPSRRSNCSTTSIGAQRTELVSERVAVHMPKREGARLRSPTPTTGKAISTPVQSGTQLFVPVQPGSQRGDARKRVCLPNRRTFPRIQYTSRVVGERYECSGVDSCSLQVSEPVLLIRQ